MKTQFVPMALYRGYLAMEPKPRKFAVGKKTFIHSFHTQAMGSDGNGGANGIYICEDGLCVIPVFGPMYKGGGGWGYADQSEISSYVRTAKNDPSIKGTMMLFDTPGGSVAGTGDLHDEIKAHSEAKPLMSYAQDLMASAGMYAAAPSRKIFANAGATVGSVGTRLELMDASALYEKMGVKFHDITTGEFKNAGTDSKPLSADDEAYFQELIDDLGQQFFEAVASGRGKSVKSIKEMEAKVFVGQKAVDQGLVDAIMSLDAAMSVLAKAAKSADKSRNQNARAQLALTD